MICQTILNNYDNILLQYDVSITKMIKEPVALPKDEVPLWLFVTLKPNATTDRKQNNYDTIHTLIIEFDDGTSIKDFQSKYAQYKYALHTTSSHKPEHNKFRVLLPLDKSYDYQLFKQQNVKQSLIQHFKGIDPSCFSNFQKIPALPSNPTDYYYYFNKGEISFGYSEIECEVNKLKLIDISKQQMNDTLQSLKPQMKTNIEAYKNKVWESVENDISKIPPTKNGNRYNNLVTLTAKMCNAKFPDGYNIFENYEIESTIKRVYWDNAIAKLVSTFIQNR